MATMYHEVEPKLQVPEMREHSGEFKKKSMAGKLWDVMEYLGYTKKPRYMGQKTPHRGHDLWHVCVVVFERTPINGNYRIEKAHYSYTEWSTFEDAIEDVALQTLTSLLDRHSALISDSTVCHYPHRASGTESYVVPPGD